MKIDTTTILLIAAAGVAVYFVTRPRTTVGPQYPYNAYTNPSGYGGPGAGTGLPIYGNPAYNSQLPGGSTTAQDITAGGTAAAGILDIISNWNK